MKKNIFTVENAKIANVTYSYHPESRFGYITDGNGIVFATVKSVEFNLKTREVKTTLQDNSGKTYVRDGAFAMYETPADYEKNNPIRLHTWEAANIIKCADHCRMSECRWVETDAKTETEPSYGYIEGWCFENGEPVAVPLVINTVIDDGKPRIADGHLPDKFWKSRDEAFSYNEYKVVDEDGEEFIEQGVNKRLALTDEQQKIVNELDAVFQKALDAGIHFIWDRDYCDFVEAYNGEHVYEFGYETESHEGGELFEARNVVTASTKIRFFDYISDDPYCFAMKPTPRQQKAWKKAHPDTK
jgi:hypothetical protein